MRKIIVNMITLECFNLGSLSLACTLMPCFQIPPCISKGCDIICCNAFLDVELECITSYDVTALYTSVPVGPVLQIIKNILEQDMTTAQNQDVSTTITQLEEFCLNNTYFLFQGQYYGQMKR